MGESPDVLARRQSRAGLLIYLAVERERMRDTVLGVFWPDSPQKNAQGALNQAMLDLRGILGGEWCQGRGDRLTVAQDVLIDLEAFQDAVARGAHTEALALYRGPFLDGFYLRDKPEFQRWVDEWRGRLAWQYHDAVRAALDESISREDRGSAVEIATRWVELHPIEDEAHYSLIALLAEDGHRAKAVQHFEFYCSALAKDGLEPLAELAELVARIRRGEIKSPHETVRRWPVGRGPRGGAATLAGTAPLGGREALGPRLVRIAEGGREAEAYVLGPGSTRVGRSEGDLVFRDDRFLSARHASFSVRHDKSPDSPTRFYVTDLGSLNGVFVRITNEWPLQHGDELAVGKQVFRFERDQ